MSHEAGPSWTAQSATMSGLAKPSRVAQARANARSPRRGAAEPAALGRILLEQRIDHGVLRGVVGLAAVVVGDADLGRDLGEHLVVRVVAALGEQNADSQVGEVLARDLP